MSIKAILFDLDGTLCNTLQDLAAATNTVITRHGYEARPADNFRHYVGDGAKMQLKRAIGQEISPELFDRMYQEYIDYYGTHYLEQTAPYEGVVETLAALTAKGIKMAVVTNKPQQMASDIVRELFGDTFLGVWGNDPAFPLKPHPAMTLQVMNRLGVKPEETLFVGDSGVDMQTAQNAGATGVGVTWGFRGREELSAAGADHLIDSAQQLLTLI